MSKGRRAIPITRSTSGARSRAPMNARPISPVGPVTATVSMPRFLRKAGGKGHRPFPPALLHWLFRELQLHDRSTNAGSLDLRLQRSFGEGLLGGGGELDLERRLGAGGEAERTLAARQGLRLAARLDFRRQLECAFAG